MYKPEYTKKFYNAFGEYEWARLEATAYGRLQAIIHNDFILRYLKEGNRVLDAGSGPGRFSITAASAGGKVTVLDISDKQLEIAREKIYGAGQLKNVEKLVEADIADLSMLPDDYYDMVICFGGALSYVCEKRYKAAGELVRVTRPGGIILASVMSRCGTMLGITKMSDVALLENPYKSEPGRTALWSVLETGDLAGFFSPRVNMMHAPMHLFTADGLQSLFRGCEILQTAGSNVTIEEFSPAGEKIAANPAAWSTLVEMERKLNHDPGLLNCGSHIIIAVRK
jgi:SAM-dependent methyltransferase